MWGEVMAVKWKLKKLSAHKSFWTAGAALFAGYTIKVAEGRGRLMLEKNKTNFCTFIFFSLQTLRKSRMFVQCEMLIYVKCLWCHVKHPVRLREINVTKTFLSRWWDRSKFKDHMKKQTFIVKVTKALFSLLLLKQGKRASCYSDMS